MCGISGLFSLIDEPVGRETLSSMLNSLSHRGPDARCTWMEGSIGLEHNRLSILDLSEAANQPMISQDGSGSINHGQQSGGSSSLSR